MKRRGWFDVAGDVFMYGGGVCLLALLAWVWFFAPPHVRQGEAAVAAVQAAADDAWRPWTAAAAPVGSAVPRRRIPYECSERVPRVGPVTLNAYGDPNWWRDRCEYEEAVADWAREHAPRVSLDRPAPQYVFKRGRHTGRRYIPGDWLEWSAEPPGEWAARCPPHSRSLETGTMVVMDGAVRCLTMRAER